MIESIEALEDLLSRPSQADIEAMRSLKGDLLLVGAGGKMGPTLAMLARRAADAAGSRARVIAVSRFSDAEAARRLQAAGIETVSADILDRQQVEALPDAPNVIFMTGRKFGSEADASATWASNTYGPAMIAERYPHSRIVAFSTGNVYPLVPVAGGGATEQTRPDPVGEYGQSALGRERIFEYFSRRNQTPVTILRLNYATELRYGVLLDIGRKVYERRPIELSMGYVNVMWQGDANSVCLRSFPLCAAPPTVLNLTGPETLAVRDIAERFGRIFGIAPCLEGVEAETALLNNAARCQELFGPPTVTVDLQIEWIAGWIASGGQTHGKPTKFERRDGKF